MKPMTKHIIIAFLFLLFCSSLGCTSIKKAYYKDEYISSQMQNYSHTTNFIKLWSEARTILFESGFIVRDSGNGYNVETEWGHINDYTRRRYLLVGYTNSDGTGSIQFNYVEETRHEGVRPSQENGRDYEMEYELLRRVDYNKWTEIDRAADNYANAKVQN